MASRPGIVEDGAAAMAGPAPFSSPSRGRGSRRTAPDGRTFPVNRNLITRLGLAGGLVAAAVASVFLVMIVAIRDQRDASRALARAQLVVQSASALEAELGANPRSQEPIRQEAARLRILLAGRPDQLQRLQVAEAAAGQGRLVIADAALTRIVLVESREAAASRSKADSSADRAIVLGIVGLIGSILLIAGLVLYMANAIVVPLRRTTRAARLISAGDLSSRVKEEGDAETRELAETFNRMAESLQESERQKDEFFALVSHELRTPLTSIIGYLELVQDDDGLDEESRGFLEIVDRNARRLLRLVGDMLFVAQVEAGRLSLERTEVDLAAVAEQAVDAAQPSAQRRGVVLNLQTEPVPTIQGDRDRLGQTMDNLISNALKFTPEGAAITVRVREVRGAVEVAVADEGAGIPAEDLSHLFERFYRSGSASRRTVPGVGLGLSIVKTIVEGHGGDIRIESTEGEGTTVTIRFPLAPVLPPRAPTDGSAAAA